jgi:AraC-like DNA-binding protein
VTDALAAGIRERRLVLARLTELRLRKAANLLAHRDGRISDIAFACASTTSLISTAASAAASG